MNKLTFLTSLLCLAILAPAAMADRKPRPFEYHGTATRIDSDGSLLPKDKPRNHPLWMLHKLSPITSKMEAPSGRQAQRVSVGSSSSSLLSCLCPWNWFKKN